MSDRLPVALADAEARSRDARERLFGTLGRMQARLDPMALAQDAVETVAAGVMRDTVETVKARPRLIATLAGGALLLIARKPIARLLAAGAKGATSAAQASLKKRAAAPTSTKRASPKKGSRT